MTFITEPFGFEFFVRAMIAGVIVGITCGAVGTHVALRNMSAIGNGLSQCTLGGVAVAVVAGVHPLLGAIAGAVVATWLLTVITRHRGIHLDSAIGLVSTSMFALGVAVISANRESAPNLSDLLFGNVLAVTTTDILLVGIVGSAVVTWIEMSHKELTVAAFDPDSARTIVRDPVRTEFVFQLALAGVVVAAVQVVGVLLIAATLVLPAATARTHARSALTMLRASALIGGATAAIGLYASYHGDIASGPAIVLAGTAAFAIGWLTRPGARLPHRTLG
jgi:manganese/iron transport system permease protein/iron/zinc/copper transport system permease protein